MSRKIEISGAVDVDEQGDVSYTLDDAVVSTSDRKELSFWSTDPVEGPQGDLFENIVHKTPFIRAFDKLVPRLELTGDESVLEVGAGHGWASVMLKQRYPGCYVVTSDISRDAVGFVGKYERFLETPLDEKWAFNSRRIPFADGQFDVVFAFAAFHHFGEHGDFSAALSEMVRVLRPGGRAVLLYEPTSPTWLYDRAVQRVNRKRETVEHDIDEDVLVLARIEQLAESLGCRFEGSYYPAYEDREGIVEMVYYFVLSGLAPLRRILPCTVNVVVRKPSDE